MKLSFYIQNERVFDTKGNEILEDENGIIRVDIDGEIRRFVKTKLIRWLEINPEIRQAKVPKIKPVLSQYEAQKLGVSPNPAVKPKKRQKEIKIKPVKPEKVRAIKVERPKKEKIIKVKPEKVKKPMGRPCIYQRDENGKPIKPKVLKGRKGGDYGFSRRKVLCITTGQTFDSMYQAGKILGINRAAIHHVISGKYKTTKGYTFQYVQNA